MESSGAMIQMRSQTSGGHHEPPRSCKPVENELVYVGPKANLVSEHSSKKGALVPCPATG